MNQVDALEQAILERANRLAREYRQRANHHRDQILREAHEKLKLREDHEVMMAKSRAERVFRERVQADELTIQQELDLLRWSQVLAVQQRLLDRLRQFTADQPRYRDCFKQLLIAGVEQLPQWELVAEVNRLDLEWLTPIWDIWIKDVAPDRTIELSTRPRDSLGGVLLHSHDNRIRLDNSFEGRIERLGDQLHQIITEHLFPNYPVADGRGEA